MRWYRDWAKGFGLTIEQLDSVRPPAAMNAVNHFLWNMSHRGNLAECLAATNLAMNGRQVTGLFKSIKAFMLIQIPEVTMISAL